LPKDGLLFGFAPAAFIPGEPAVLPNGDADLPGLVAVLSPNCDGLFALVPTALALEAPEAPPPNGVP
jgi:hypothetical protein